MKNIKSTLKTICGLISCLLASLVLINEAKADGNEILGLPTIDIAQGSQILVEGTGLYNNNQPGDISIAIPADVTIAQVLLYWTGRSTEDDPGDVDTIQVNGMDVTAPRIGKSLTELPSNTYRADITETNSALGWIVAGQATNLTVSGLDFTYQNDGAAIVVILDDGSMSDIQILDGNDFAYEPYGYETVPVDFPVVPISNTQTGYLSLIVTDIDVPRPAALDVTVDGVTTRLDDVFLDNEGNFLDIVELEVSLAAGATNVTVQLWSINDGTNHAASLAWCFVAWQIAIPHTACGGGGLTPGFWQNKHGIGLIDEYGALADLNELCLRDDDGEHAEFATLREFRAWIKARRAKNMAFQLSGHLAAMYMNVLVGSVNGGALVYIGHEGDMISINNLLSSADDALYEDGKTFSGDENRDYQEMLKNALDKANNNQNWVYPCTHSD